MNKINVTSTMVRRIAGAPINVAMPAFTSVFEITAMTIVRWAIFMIPGLVVARFAIESEIASTSVSASHGARKVESGCAKIGLRGLRHHSHDTEQQTKFDRFAELEGVCARRHDSLLVRSAAPPKDKRNKQTRRRHAAKRQSQTRCQSPVYQAHHDYDPKKHNRPRDHDRQDKRRDIAGSCRLRWEKLSVTAVLDTRPPRTPVSRKPCSFPSTLTSR